jgi:hypothetical protein
MPSCPVRAIDHTTLGAGVNIAGRARSVGAARPIIGRTGQNPKWKDQINYNC